MSPGSERKDDKNVDKLDRKQIVADAFPEEARGDPPEMAKGSDGERTGKNESSS